MSAFRVAGIATGKKGPGDETNLGVTKRASRDRDRRRERDRDRLA
jgi:hypothetical protein